MPPRFFGTPSFLRRLPLPPLLLASFLLASFLLAGCDPGFPAPERGDTISEEAFVETMVELRRGAAHWEFRRLPPEERDAILAARGVTAEDLLRFVAIRGTDVLYMNQVWTRVEAGFTGRPVSELEGEVPDHETLVEEGFLPPDALPATPQVPDAGLDPGADADLDPGT
jgi:hypothetical protein